MILLSGTALLIVLFVVCNLTNFGIIIIACLAQTSHTRVHIQQEQYHLGTSWACLLSSYHSPSRQSSDPTGASNFSREATLPLLVFSSTPLSLASNQRFRTAQKALAKYLLRGGAETGGAWMGCSIRKSVRRVFFGVC